MRPWLKYTLLVICGLMLGIIIQRYGIVGNYIKPLFQRGQNAVTGKAGFEKISLTVDEKDWNTLLAYTDSARMAGIIDDRYKVDFKATASYQNTKNAACEIRLKGDWADHASREKPSLRVVMGDSVAVWGIQRFSLQHPSTRNYIHEWFYMEAMREEGIIAPRYKFVELEVNGKSYGTYAFEEHFDKILIESNHRREGPIIKFDESAMWEERARHPEMVGDPTGQQSSANAPVIAFQDKKILKDTMLSAEFTAARTLLEGFRDGKYSASKVFNTDQLATFFALSELLGARHGSGYWHNLRFYYNPITALLEPITFDGDAGNEIPSVLGIGTKNDTLDIFYQRLFADSAFNKIYLKKLEKVSVDSYLTNLLKKKQSKLDSLLSRLLAEFPDAKFTDKPFRQNSKTICQSIHPKKCVNAYLKKQTVNSIEIEWANIQPLQIEITGLQADSILLKPTGKPTAKGTAAGQIAPYQTSKFTIPNGFKIPKKMKLMYQAGPLKNKGKDKVQMYERLNEKYVFNTNPFPVEIPFPKNSDIGNYGNRRVNYIDIAVYNCPLNFNGSERLDYTKGFLVITDSVSIIKNYQFKNVKGQGILGRNITGSFTFYGGKAIIEDCLFENITSEDVLNLVRCDFELRNCTFRNCSSDAFDADFCTGKVINCRVENCHNDGFDISGSTVTFENCAVVNAGDKGISVGEASTANIKNLTVNGSVYGVGVKDWSHATISNSTLTNCKTGVGIYQKKPEFGGARAALQNIAFINCVKKTDNDPQSTITQK